MDNQELIRTTPLKGLVATRAAGGANPTDAYFQLIELIRQRCGETAATLFAEPHPAKTDSSEPAMTWFTSLSGPLSPLADLDEVARAPVIARLRERLEKLWPLLEDKQLGSMMASWLYIPSDEYILSIGGDPVLICWGYVSQNVALSPSLRAEHFNQTLGKYAPNVRTPPFTPQEAADYIKDKVKPGQAWEPATSVAADEAAAAAHASAEIPSWKIHSRVPLVASAIAAIVLSILLIPAMLLDPKAGFQALERRGTLLRQDNEGLADRLRELEEAGRQRVCRLPNGQLSPLPAAASPPGAPGTTTPPSTTPAMPPPRADLLPPEPSQVQLPRDPAGPTSGSTTLNDLIDRSVVFVIGNVAGQQGVGMGSGFFVTADRIVTNRHVVENLVPDSILVTNKKMGHAVSARVVAITPQPSDSDHSVRDFAVLAVDSPGLSILKLGPSIDRSASVVAAGYPFVLVQDDPGYRKLKQGDRSASPAVTAQTGFVIQKRDDDPVKQVTHSASLGHGNSGGPLFDMCGRVVGVNTTVRNEGELSTTVNFAQDVTELRAFLSENGVTPQMDETRTACPPPVAQAAAQPGQQPAPGQPGPQPANLQPPPSQAAPNPTGGRPR
jgi:S1-C subfamily serine protease